MNYQTIIVEKRERIATITLNRPHVLNALNGDILRELQQALKAIEGDPDAKVVVLRGSGDKAFCAGTDVKYALAQTPEAAETEVHQLLRDTFRAVRLLPKPVICAVHGYCLGAALELMLCCDLAIASETARFSMPEINRGIASIMEAALLPRAMSIFLAREICLTGDYFDARKAERCGLVNEVVPQAELDNRVRQVARNLASKSAVALAVQKDIINKWLTTDLEASIDYSMRAQRLCWKSEERTEAMRAFVEEKKDAEF